MSSFKALIPKFGILITLIPTILGAALDTGADRLIARKATSLLQARDTPFQTRILDTGTTFTEDNNGVWQLIDCDGDIIPDLVYIKTQNTGSGRVEVHIASASSDFKTRIFESGTTFTPENDGTWLMVPSRTGARADLALIKTSNTASGNVEVHIASGSSGYQTRTIETATIFGDETDGSWSLLDFDGDGILDLVFIKTSNTGTRTVEVHVASGASKYQTHIFDGGSDFAPETDGVWSLAPYSNGPDLCFIRTSNTGTNTVEVHVSSRQSKYQTRILDTGSDFGEETDGFWSLIDFNRDGKVDLVFIKTQNTGTGTIEIHIASGS